jgi:FtsZ-binding cell division protein ZapB
MADHDNDIEELFCRLDHVIGGKPHRAALTALVADRDGLRSRAESSEALNSTAVSIISERDALKQRVAELEAKPDPLEAIGLVVMERNALLERVAEQDAEIRTLIAKRDALKQENDALRSRCKVHQDEVLDRVFEMDALRKRVAELEAHPPADRDRELRERLVCAALTGIIGDISSYEDAADAAVRHADATLAAMRKEGGGA